MLWYQYVYGILAFIFFFVLLPIWIIKARNKNIARRDAKHIKAVQRELELLDEKENKQK